MPGAPEPHQRPSALRRFTNARWFQVLVVIVIFAVSVYFFHRRWTARPRLEPPIYVGPPGRHRGRRRRHWRIR